jgi:4-hydroxybenzoate polyprenyltransferase
MEQYNGFTLFLLFLVGFFGHTFGFVFNDIIDYNIDKSSKEIRDRPLISGTITLRNAWLFAVLSMGIAFIISIYLALENQYYFPIVILAISAFFILLYDLISKKLPFMDIFVSLGIFFLILYGAFYGYNQGNPIEDVGGISWVGWLVCLLGSIQVFFMQIVAGGMKDIENDYFKGARTAAIALGVRIMNGTLKVSTAFKSVAYGIQFFDLILVFLPFFVLPPFTSLTILSYFQWVMLVFIGILMVILSSKLLSIKKFDRVQARKLIGSHYMINFALVPVLLMGLNPWAGILAFFPGIGFLLNNIIVHGTLLQPKTM